MTTGTSCPNLVPCCYCQALGILFDPQSSFVKLKSIKVSGPSTIEADYESGGYLKFPWKPRVAPYEGECRQCRAGEQQQLCVHGYSLGGGVC